MPTIHDQFTRQMRNRLKTTGIGLGLVRLLQDAKRFDEARSTLYLLEYGIHDAVSKVQDDSAFCNSPNSFGVGAEARKFSDRSAFAVIQ